VDNTPCCEIPERILTERLLMRMPKRSDAGDVLVAVEESHPELRRWQGWAREMPSLSAIEAHIARARAAWELRERNLFHVYNHAERFLGTCGLEKIDWTLRAFEIGYWLRTSCVGKGYMTEAVAALEKQVFERCLGRSIVIKCDSLNERSAAIPRRLGFQLDGVLRCERLNALGEPQDTMVWSKTRADYRSASAVSL